jgi:hypothetical protein
MKKRETIIPAAYIFTDAIHERYEQQYASTLSEWLVVEDEMKHYTHTHAVNFYVASIVTRLDMTDQKKYMFVAYTPNEKRLAMAAFGDFDKLIVVVDSGAKKKRLQEFNRAVSELVYLARKFEVYRDKLKLLSAGGPLHDMIGDKLFEKEFRKPANLQVEVFNRCRSKLIADFKKEFCRSVSFAKRFSE